MTEENQPVEEVETEPVTQPENTEEVEAPETETEGETPEPSTEIDEKEKARKHFEERQSKREMLERTQRENEYLKEELKRRTQPEAPQQPQRNFDPNLPDLDRYLEEGKTAQEWGVDFHNYQESAKKQASQRYEVENTFSGRMEEYSKNTSEIYEYAKAVDRMVLPAVQESILLSEKAPELIEKLALYPEVSKELNNSRNVYELAKKISKLEAEFEKEKTPPVSGAHKPIDTVKSTSPAPKVDISKMSGAEYREHMNNKRKG
jgi:hypothetical protein